MQFVVKSCKSTLKRDIVVIVSINGILCINSVGFYQLLTVSILKTVLVVLKSQGQNGFRLVYIQIFIIHNQLAASLLFVRSSSAHINRKEDAFVLPLLLICLLPTSCACSLTSCAASLCV